LKKITTTQNRPAKRPLDVSLNADKLLNTLKIKPMSIEEGLIELRKHEKEFNKFRKKS